MATIRLLILFGVVLFAAYTQHKAVQEVRAMRSNKKLQLITPQDEKPITEIFIREEKVDSITTTISTQQHNPPSTTLR